jgi:uncharacterized protein DUF5989
MQFLRHLLALLKDLFGFARQNKIWWIAPLVIVLLALALVMIAGQTVAPFIYTLF